MYRLDHSYYPIYNNPKDIDSAPHFLAVSLAAQVAYLSALFDEIFPARNASAGIPPTHGFHYFNRRQSPEFFASQEEAYFQKSAGADSQYEWFSFSHGPDAWGDGGLIPYSVSSGLTSAGDIAQFGP